MRPALPPRFAERWGRRLRRLRPPRSLRPTTSGAVFLAATLAVGLAAVNTANNLLHLLLGAMLGFVVASGWLSDRMLRRVTVVRRLPTAATAGKPVRIAYEVANGKSRLPSWVLSVRELDREPRGFLAAVSPGEVRVARAEHVFPARGVHPLKGVVLETSFPFGFFRKARTLTLPGVLVVRPRSDLKVRRPLPAGGQRVGWEAAAAARAGTRGEFRSLREYRAGDDPRDVHWRSSARLGAPVVREYERDTGEGLWICLDVAHAPSERLERTIEVAASVAASSCARGERFALVLPGREVPPGAGGAHLDRVLDALARVEAAIEAPPPVPPAGRNASVLVTPGGAPPGWGDVLRPEDGRLPADTADLAGDGV